MRKPVHAPGGTPLKSLLLRESTPAVAEPTTTRRVVTVRAANTEGQRSSAHILVDRMYASRGYSTAAKSDAGAAERLTLIGEVGEVVVGTLTIGFDGADGLLAGACFGDLVGTLRNEGTKLCEFIKLAIDSAPHSQRVLASLFHTALIFAHDVHGCHKILIEVNPRHVAFYRSMLGFLVLGEERLNPRVNAPAVLMGLDAAQAAEQIRQIHTKAAKGAGAVRSMYRYCFSQEELAGILSRLPRGART